MTPEESETRYAKSGDVHVAYSVSGDGPIDLVIVPGMATSIDQPIYERQLREFLRAIDPFTRRILFDKRGTGSSDRLRGVPSLEERMDDVRAVMDATGSPQAALLGAGEGAPMSLLFAATYPERTLALVLYNPVPRFTQTSGFPLGPTREEYERRSADAVAGWGTIDYEAVIDRQYQHARSTDEELREHARGRRLAASPGAAALLFRMNLEIDVRSVLPSIRVPVLVLYPTQNRDIARFFATHISTAELIETRETGTLYERLTSNASDIERFLRGALAARRELEAEPPRVLATVLFTDLVDSTEKALELGPQWPGVLEKHNAIVRRELGKFSGREVDSAGDGFFASGFDGPARAIRCACAIRDAIGELGLPIRFGVHTGECDIVDGKLSGLAVTIGARVAGQAGRGEVFVSSTVKDLVAGSGVEFESQGARVLKGLGDWELFAVVGVP
jgi:class 3 adenylate cyclase/pimeloyl-ACP methyl ester carboxylesterase